MRRVNSVQPDDGEPWRADPRHVADELVRCRRRGLDRLDSKVGSEPPLDLPLLTMLCAAWFDGRTDRPRDRGAAIGMLVREGAEVLRSHRPEDSRLVVEVFFGDPGSTVPGAPPGELLDKARRSRTRIGDAAFRRYRREALLRLGQVLIDLAEPAGRTSIPVARWRPDATEELRMGTSTAAVSAMSADPDVEVERIIEHLRGMAAQYEISEVLEVIVRFDTPDILE